MERHTNNRKVRSDARLKLLPEEQRPMVREWLDQDGWQSACARCSSELGIPVKKSALYEAIAFWDAQESLDEAFAFADAQEELMKEFRPEEAGLAREFGEFVLLQLANRTKDKDLFTAATMAQDMRLGRELKARELDARIAGSKLKHEQKEEELKLARAKFQRDTCKLFLKWSDDERAKQIVTGGGTNAEKIEALGRAMFGDDWYEDLT